MDALRRISYLDKARLRPSIKSRSAVMFQTQHDLTDLELELLLLARLWFKQKLPREKPTLAELILGCRSHADSLQKDGIRPHFLSIFDSKE